jgi:hypothetical protein
MNQISYIINAGFFVFMGTLLVTGHPGMAIFLLAVKSGVDMMTIAYIDKKTEELKQQLEKELNGDTNTTNGN